ncbi:MAG: family 16 glycoside hydrolase [Planctomycetota bacterium]
MRITALVSCFVFNLALCSIGFSQDSPVLLFEDDFERSESQEESEELGNGWGTNSQKRAAGNKQADLVDGVLHVVRHPKADHAVSLVQDATYTDCRVELRFRLDDKRDDFGIDFADMDYPQVHAGHICKAIFRPTGIELLDFKNGRMKKEYRDASQAGTLSKKEKEAVKRWQKKFMQPIDLGKWHKLVVTIKGDTMRVELNGALAGEFSSPGMAHPEKDRIRFSARREVRLDDLKLFALPSSS